MTPPLETLLCAAQAFGTLQIETNGPVWSCSLISYVHHKSHRFSAKGWTLADALEALVAEARETCGLTGTEAPANGIELPGFLNGAGLSR